MSSSLSNLIFFGGIIAVFWFLVMRPQQQRAKKQAAMLEALAVGDEIVTIGGIFATIVEVGDRLRVRVADGSELEIARQAVAQVVPQSEAAGEEDHASEPESVIEGQDASRDA